MKKIIIGTILSLLFFISVILPLSADESVVYRNTEHGFSLSYPKNWVKRETGDEVELYSSEDFSDTYKDGIMFGVYYYKTDENLTPEQVLRESMNVENDFPFTKFKEQELAGETWAYTTSLNTNKDIKAEFYVCKRNNVFYVIAFGFTPSAKAGQFSPVINDILHSFAFLNPEQPSSTGEPLSYENKELGLSFTYPDGWHLEEEDNSILVSSTNNMFSEDGAGIAIFIGPAKGVGLDTTPKTKEELWNSLKEREPNLKELSRQNKKRQGAEWLYVEFEDTDNNILAHFYLLMQNETVYMVGAVYHPQEVLKQYGEQITKIMDSLKLVFPQ
jgi:hypothetical protein